MATESNKQKQQMSELLAAMQRIPNLGGQIRAVVQPVQPEVAVVRAEKIQCLTVGLRKSNKIKDFRDTVDANIKDWIKKFDFEITALKRMVGINDDLTRDEYIPLLRDKLGLQCDQKIRLCVSTKKFCFNMGYSN